MVRVKPHAKVEDVLFKTFLVCQMLSCQVLTIQSDRFGQVQNKMYFLMFPLPGRNISECLCAIREQKEVLGYQPHFDKQSALIKQYGKGSRAVNSSLLTFSLLYKREKNEDSLAMWPTLSREGGTFITRTIKWHQEQTAKRSSK